MPPYQVGGRRDSRDPDRRLEALPRANAAIPAAFINRATRRGQRSRIAIDLSKASFLDSTALHAILAANLRRREHGGRPLILQGLPQVSRLFELIGLSDHLNVIRNETELEQLCHAWKDPRPSSAGGLNTPSSVAQNLPRSPT